MMSFHCIIQTLVTILIAFVPLNLIKNTADRAKSDLYLDIYLEIDSEGRLIAKLSDERGGFNFPIVNNSSICSSTFIRCIPEYLSVDTIFHSLFFLSIFHL